jgi:phenylalanyl-tRNA synthetase beta chain
MKVSLNTIRFVNQHFGSAGDPAPDGVVALADKIGAQLGAIEEIVDFGSKYQGVIVVKVVSCVDHPNADRLHLCKVDDGGKAENVERDENGHVQVVCGAPNVHEGMLAVWLPPGITVPSTVDKDPFVLEAREIRGQVSNGMMASLKELAIGDSHEGILEVDKDVAPGTGFASAYNLEGESVIDIENKMFTHRPDCFGFIGVARELEGIQHRPYKSPDWYTLNPEIPGVEAEPLPLEVRNELPELVPRFCAITMRDVKIGPSPVWLQILLAELGLRPINNIVDYTNFFMLETGQPIHAYDYDKVKARTEGDGARLIVRHPNEGEKITLLNGKTIEPRADAMMVATDTDLACVGGAMGGSETEVDENTKNVIIEAANWDMYEMRRTAMEHGIFTDAVTRFTKGQSPLQNKLVVAKIVDEIRTFAGGKVASELIDDIHLPDEVVERGSVHPPVNVSTDFINVRLGLKLSASEMAQLLENVEFDVQQNGDELEVKAPFWRTDIEIPEDVVEEVGRLYGYDKLPLDLPKRGIAPAPKDPLLELKRKIRETLSRAGANEVLTYSFVHGNLIDKVGQDKSQAFQIANALSPDLQYYRLSLTPSLLEKVHPNVKAGYDEFAIFELGKAHSKDLTDEEGLPKEFARIACVFAADKKASQKYAGAAYYQARKLLTYLLEEVGYNGKLELKPLRGFKDLPEGHRLIEQMLAPYEQNRSAVLWNGEMIVGVIGEYKRSVARSLKLPGFCAGFETFHRFFALNDSGRTSYKALPRYPKVEQDICLKVAADMPYQQLFDFVKQQIGEHQMDNVLSEITLIDIYQRDDSKDHKQITFRLSIASYDRTLTDAEVTKVLDQVAEAAKEQFGAERI